jgi:DnaJ-class molecular chaperone
MDTSDYYKILGIPRTADARDIKLAYRALSLKYHPDRNIGNSDSLDKFKLINEAYETLKDADTKLIYDQNGSNVDNILKQDFVDIDQLFGMMFGGGMNRMSGPNVHIFHGEGGGGNFNMHQHVFNQMQKPIPIIKIVKMPLSRCFTGYKISVDIDRSITSLNSTRSETETLYIDIPAGINNDEVILLTGYGNISNTDSRGDVKIVIQIENDTCFIREGLDLILEKTLSLKEALCGFSFTIPHIGGKLLNLNNTTNISVIHPKFRKIIPGFGMIKGDVKGNLIIEFNIDFPLTLSASQIDELSHIL